jgi:release factor glutamine methyltransferase
VTTRIYRDKEFELLDGVYDPSEDSYMLVEAALAEVKAGEKVLEVGTGSGIVSLFLKDRADVVATDISPLACENARRNGVEVVRADLYHGICGPFDLVIFNPPYLPTADEDRLGSWLDHAFDGGPTGRKVIGRFLEGIGSILPPCGRVLTVFSSLTGIDEVEEMYRRHGFSVETVSTEKVPFETLIVLKCVRRA